MIKQVNTILLWKTEHVSHLFRNKIDTWSLEVISSSTIQDALFPISPELNKYLSLAINYSFNY